MFRAGPTVEPNAGGENGRTAFRVYVYIRFRHEYVRELADFG